jgi:hypothetical protein
MTTTNDALLGKGRMVVVMNEVKPNWLPDVEAFFKKMAGAVGADRETAIEHVREKLGLEAAAKIEAMYLALDRAKLTDLSARLAKVKLTTPFISPEPETVKEVAVASWRRDRKPKPEALFISPALQPSVDEATKPQPKGEPQPKGGEVISLSKFLASLGAQKREELFKTINADNADKGTKKAKPGQEEFELQEKQPHNPKSTYSNTRLSIRKLGFVCSHNVFQDRYLVETTEGEKDLSDAFCVMLRGKILDKFKFAPSKDDVREVVKGECLEKRFNPILEYLDGLKWDGTPRVDNWLNPCLAGIDDTPLVQAVGRKFLCALVRRAKQPGCKFDHVMVWEGEQDIGKSTGLKVLTGAVGEDYFSDQTILDVREERQQELTRGRWLFEIAELTGIRKAEVEKVKGFISRTHDRCRSAWGHFVVDQARQCVFAGTTNDREYLIDQTGNRRWWPIGWITNVDVGWIKANRDQLFAEAVVLERDEALFMSPDLVVEMREREKAKGSLRGGKVANGYIKKQLALPRPTALPLITTAPAPLPTPAAPPLSNRPRRRV